MHLEEKELNFYYYEHASKSGLLDKLLFLIDKFIDNPTEENIRKIQKIRTEMKLL